jgi:alcohol sulfotransferase
MVRDPRDVMVSSYFHATRQKRRFEGDIGDFLRDREQGIRSLTRYLNGWSAGVRNRRHIVLSYEDLSRDPVGETARVLAFLRVEIKPQALSDAVEAAQFQNMRRLEQATGLPGHDYDRSDTESLRVRRGKVGGFADYLSAEQIEFIDATWARELTADTMAVLERTASRLAILGAEANLQTGNAPSVSS